MVSERVGDGFSRGGNVFSRRVAECAEFSQSFLSMLFPFGRVGVGRCVSKLKSEEASGEQKPKLFERSTKSAVVITCAKVRIILVAAKNHPSWRANFC